MIDRSAVTKYRDSIVSDISKLIGIPSVRGDAATGAPFGEATAEALRFVLAKGEELGFHSKNIDGYAGHVEYGDSGPLYAVLTHLDVVPPGDGWTCDPYGGVVNDGHIYGRGAADNKGPAIAALYVLRAFADEVSNPKARTRLIFGTNEESGMAGIRRYFETEEMPVFGFSPDSAYPLYNREMGIVNAYLEAPRTGRRIVSSCSGGKALNMVADEAHATFHPEYIDRLADLIAQIDTDGAMEHRLELEPYSNAPVLRVCGISAHGGRPATGVSAIAYLVHALSELAADSTAPNAASGTTDGDGGGVEPEIQKLWKLLGFETRGDSLGIACRDAESGELSVNWGTIEIDDSSVRAGLNIRYPVSADFDAINRVLAFRAFRLGFTTKFEHHLKPLFIPAENPYVASLLRSYESVTKENSAPLSMSGGTYARMLEGRGVAFGPHFPGAVTNVHQPDERVSIDSLMRHAEISLQALYDLSVLE